MTKENKLPEVGKKYQEISTGRIGTLLSLGYWSGRYCAELEEIKGQRHIVREYEAFRFGFEQIPEQEPTAENHIPDIRKKVDKVQEAKDINVPTKSIWKPMSELRGDIMNIYIKWDDDLDIMPAQYSNRRKIIFANVGGETCQFECNYHKFKMWCTLSDFNNQVQDNTDRLDKLETKLNK